MGMDVFDAIRNRRATRHFAHRPLDEKAVHALLDAAVLAPSAVNSQPWSFVIIQDARLLRQLSEEAKVRLAADDHWRGHLPVQDPDFDIFYGAGTLIVICATRDGFSPVGDCYLAAANLMLAACATGLATCPIGFAREILQTDPWRERLQIPQDAVPVLPIAVGYPQGEMPRTPRHPPVIHRWLR